MREGDGQMSVDRRGTFGAQLRHYREVGEVAGFSLAELAEKTQLSEKGLGAIERGERGRPHPANFKRIADVPGLDAAQRAGLWALPVTITSPTEDVTLPSKGERHELSPEALQAFVRLLR